MTSMIDVVEQLHSEFGAARARTEILQVLNHHGDLLDAAPGEARAELLQRLSRQGLHGRAHSDPRMGNVDSSSLSRRKRAVTNPIVLARTSS